MEIIFNKLTILSLILVITLAYNCDDSTCCSGIQKCLIPSRSYSSRKPTREHIQHTYHTNTVVNEIYSTENYYSKLAFDYWFFKIPNPYEKFENNQNASLTFIQNLNRNFTKHVDQGTKKREIKKRFVLINIFFFLVFINCFYRFLAWQKCSASRNSRVRSNEAIIFSTKTKRAYRVIGVMQC